MAKAHTARTALNIYIYIRDIYVYIYIYIYTPGVGYVSRKQQT